MAAPQDDDAVAGGFLARWSRRKVQVRQGEPVAEPSANPNAPPAAALAALGTSAGETSGDPPLGGADPGPGGAPDSALPAAEPPPTLPTTLPTTPPPTLADVALLNTQSDYSRFVAPGVDSVVKNAALKKLFTDPHFNVMDRLDTYIDDYGAPDPLPAGMLRQMAQSQFLGLFDGEKNADTALDAPPPYQRLPPTAQATQSTQSTQSPAESPHAAACSPPTEAPPDEDADLRLQPLDAAGPAGIEPGTGPDAGRQP